MNGHGSIEERAPGVWRIRISAGHDPVTGERRVIRRTVRGTRADAELVRAQILVDRGTGDLGTNATLSALIDAWLPKARIAASTKANYEAALRVHAKPRIGHVPLAKLTVFVLDDFYQDLLEDGVSPIRIRTVHTALRSAMRRALKWRWISENPCIAAEPPPVTYSEAVAPSPAHVRSIFALAEERSHRLFTMLRVAASLGCRRGELCGLQWSDINFVDSTIHIRRSVIEVGGELIVKSVKNEKRRQPEPVPPEVMRLLREWKLQSGQQSTEDGGDWVFVAPKLGNFYRPSSLTAEFRSVADQAGVPREVKLHGLRHYVGTHMRDAGIDHDVISRRLGHSRTSTTIDMYGHAVPERSRHAAEVLERLTQDG